MFTTIVVFAALAILGSAKTIDMGYKIEQNDRILFLGHSNTLHGTTNADGFINLFKNEISHMMGNVSVWNGAFFGASNDNILSRLQDKLLTHYSPTKVILSLGTEQLTGVLDTSLKKVRFEVESLVAFLVSEGVKVILYPLLVDDERVFETTENGQSLENLAGMYKIIARDYGIMFIDLPSFINKYLEKTNIDNLPHSVLTHDGKVLNDLGHAFVASTLLKALELPSTATLGAEHNIITEFERNARITKENILRTRDFDLAIQREVVIS